MSERVFRLPGYHELNADQKRILKLPQDGLFLVVGGPGTGKSVVALMRARKFHNRGDYIFLTYNQVLNSTINQFDLSDSSESGNLSELKDLICNTIHSWFCKYYYDQTREFVPQSKPYTYRYDEIQEILRKEQVKQKSLHFIIDEGQDMPLAFYETLQDMGFYNFFIVADQNQQMTAENSTRPELTDFLDLDVGDVHELKENYRNTTPIAKFAQCFYTDKSSPKPDIPDKPSLETPILYEYKIYPDDCIPLILREADKDPKSLIGVVVASDNKRASYVDQLNQLDIERDNPKPLISTYSSSMKESDVNINFRMGGIVVLCDKSIKGLEFDVVFLILQNFSEDRNDSSALMKRFYVIASRAMKKLVLLKHESTTGGAVNILPENESLLRRKSL